MNVITLPTCIADGSNEVNFKRIKRITIYMMFVCVCVYVMSILGQPMHASIQDTTPTNLSMSKFSTDPPFTVIRVTFYITFLMIVYLFSAFYWHFSFSLIFLLQLETTLIFTCVLIDFDCICLDHLSNFFFFPFQ